ncbi:HAMP domain-containing histidine kinase [Salegentibacter sp. JZCK2]|uniref:sensor histidine kinase n=1 Tax=Salegentibacter tibetensis TaxID=2873600 RepID=UPI001CCBD7EA|nr:HAMP domain-containing sensor histidine kinase [Salegentibacter tibetensis]MBZ9729000.1 HAMP domain-containing histidine kinase [Salegentibacter tibetensis]
MKIKYKIAAIFSLIFALIIGFVCIFIYTRVANNTYEQFNKRLLDRAYTAAKILLEKDEFSKGKYERLTRQYLRNLPQEEETFFKVENNEISKESGDQHYYNEKAFLKNLEGEHVFFETNGKQAVSIFYEDNQGDYITVVSAIDEEGKNQLSHLMNILFLTSLFSLILILAISLFFASILLNPINNMITRVQQITASNLELRLDEGDGKDEISRLAATFNAMLLRLETSFYSQKKFIENASHELRTPLTIIMGEADYALQSTKKENTEVALNKIYDEATHLNELFTSLLHLSEVQAEQPNKGFEIFRIDELIQQISIRLNKLNSGNRIRLNYEEIESFNENSFEILGNRLWIEIAISNILKNALKYSGNEKVHISLGQTSKFNVINIQDFGSGISKSDLDKIFTPFYRGKNGKNEKGHGIGLALTKDIVKIHKGNIDIETKAGQGTVVSIKFPLLQF